MTEPEAPRCTWAPCKSDDVALEDAPRWYTSAAARRFGVWRCRKCDTVIGAAIPPAKPTTAEAPRLF